MITRYKLLVILMGHSGILNILNLNQFIKMYHYDRNSRTRHAMYLPKVNFQQIKIWYMHLVFVKLNVTSTPGMTHAHITCSYRANIITFNLIIFMFNLLYNSEIKHVLIVNVDIKLCKEWNASTVEGRTIICIIKF